MIHVLKTRIRALWRTEVLPKTGSRDEEDGEELEQRDEEWELTFSSDDEDVAQSEELPSSRYLQAAHNKKLIKGMRETSWNYDSSTFGPDPTYRGLYDGLYGPTEGYWLLLKPLALFFYFMPAKLWRKIEEETNRYHMQNIDKRARELRRSRRHEDSEYSETLPDIKKRLCGVRGVEELLRVIGLLIARMLAPQVRGLAAHWNKKQHGAVPMGTFGRWLPRNRFEHVMQNLHFTDNNAPQTQQDRGWKDRSVVSVYRGRLGVAKNVGR
ncbi:LOW QUALITY PROTEIN: Hypothetical protein PHPALM_1736 [Phytophthora palmivora]|uniref:PiggyBac transposable element-derived protein domain-containing protein n=1 Tax=Phytophthora palmivora TaxID=4796 RepID=A0A2P4YRQ6_9STRA|nr:LOW QUALITY PROTEIN: Hypothetical protein PHPALM_1736 [Phytophthora palmivora]